MRVVIAGLMMLEGVASGLRLARFMSALRIYPPLTIGLLVVRTGIGALLVSAGLMVLQRHPAGPVLARRGLIASAAFAALEVGFGFVPTSIFPTYRWPAVALYWCYAAGAIWWLRKRA